MSPIKIDPTFVGQLPEQCRAKGELVLRPAAAGEEELVQQVFAELSSRSAYLRFHAATPRLSPRSLQRLSRREPGRIEVALAIISGEPIGHGMWTREGDTTIAEVALAVADRHHGTHVGLALLLDLARSAREAGLMTFRCVVHPENRRLRSQLARLGASGPTGEGHTDFLLDLDYLRQEKFASGESRQEACRFSANGAHRRSRSTRPVTSATATAHTSWPGCQHEVHD